MLWFRRQFSQACFIGRNKPPHIFIKDNERKLKIKISPRHNNKGKENNRSRIPGDIKPTIPAASRMHAWLGKSRSRCIRKIRERLWRFNTAASRRGDNIVIPDCWIPLGDLLNKGDKLTSDIYLNAARSCKTCRYSRFSLSAWQEALRGTDICSSGQKI